MFPRQPLLAAARTVARRGRNPPPPVRPNPVPLSPLSPLASSNAQAGPSSLSATTSSALEQAEEQWYYVNRSEGGELPVYSKYRNRGSVTTIVRKVEGDVKTLQSQLNEYFQQSHIDPFTAPPKVTLRPTNGHLQVKGHWVEEVKGWLEGRGF